jgi:hypothetical protein
MNNSTGLLRYGDRAAREVSQRIGGTVLNLAALAALNAAARTDGMLVKVAADRSEWIFDSTVAATDATQNLIVTPTAGSGSWLRVDNIVDLKLAIAFGTADAAVLFTVPAGFRLRPLKAGWEPTADWTGGASSAIGLSSNNTAFNTKGDILGGAGGDLAATLTAAAVFTGTVGAKITNPGMVLVATNTIRFDRIVSAFTAGTGFAHVTCQIVP